MEFLAGYILSIVGVVLLFVVIELVLPNGNTNKYIRSILGMVLIFVIISPVAKFKSLDFNSLVNSTGFNYELNYEYLYDIHLKEAQNLEEGIKLKLEEEGITNAEAIVSIDKESTSLCIQQIYVDLSQAVISKNSKHINNYTTLKKIISDYANVEIEKVVVDGE